MRRSFRNLLGALRGAQVDALDTSVGAQVSQDIQMVYQMDDLSMYTAGQYGGGGFITGVAGRHVFMQLEVPQNTFGVVIEYAGITFLNANSQGMGSWVDDFAATIAASVNLLAFQEPANSPPTSTMLAGTLLAADIPLARMMSLADRFGGAGMGGLFIRPPAPGSGSRFFKTFISGAGSSNNVGMRWREINRG